MRSKGWAMSLGGVAVVSLAAMIPLSVFARLVGDGIVALVIGVPAAAIGYLVEDRTVAAFAARLKDAMDVTAVRDDLTSVAQQTLEPAHVSVWIRPPG